MKKIKIRPKKYISVAEFAEAVKVHPQTIYYHIRKGHIKMPITIEKWANRPHKTGPKQIYFAKTIDNDKKKS